MSDTKHARHNRKRRQDPEYRERQRRWDLAYYHRTGWKVRRLRHLAAERRRIEDQLEALTNG